MKAETNTPMSEEEIDELIANTDKLLLVLKNSDKDKQEEILNKIRQCIRIAR